MIPSTNYKTHKSTHKNAHKNLDLNKQTNKPPTTAAHINMLTISGDVTNCI